MSYDIAFANREQFESAWPHILKVKGKGAPITLLRGRHVRVLTPTSPKGKSAGVRIMVPREIAPAKAEGRPVGSRAVATEPPFVSRPSTIGHPAAAVPLPAAATPPATPSETDFAGRSAGISILLVVDGNIVDLNRIRLPPDTPIVDRRFEK